MRTGGRLRVPVVLSERSASNLIDAMTKRNQHLEWAPYQPMLDEAGQPYPADLAPYEDT